MDRQDEILRKLDTFGSNRGAPVDAILGHVVQQLDTSNQTSTLNSQLRTMALRQVQSPGISDGEISKSIKVPRWREVELESRFLASVSFPEMHGRQSQISEAHKQTFKWIFHDTPNQSWSSFVSWLNSTSQPLYWITGKAGSGKSTLMKFIAHTRYLGHFLRSGHHSGPIVIASFYFWANGTAMEASPEGLYKSIIYQLLDNNRDLIPLVVPKTWELLCLFGDLRAHGSLSKEDLHKVLVATVDQLSRRARVFILIDGLDEFSGDPDLLLDTLQDLLSYSVKVCVASRPWVVFEDAFHNKPHLLLQQLTRSDIQMYVDSRLNANRGFLRLRGRDPEFAQQLTADIVEKAQGVFLWVRVVIDSLLIGLRHDDRISDLQRRLDQLPPDLESLYESVVNSWDPFYFKHAAQYFKLMLACAEPPPVPVFFFADAEEGDNIQQAISNQRMGAGTLESMVETVRRRLNSRCLGLLEVTGHEPLGVDEKPDYRSARRSRRLHRPHNPYRPRRPSPGPFDARIDYLHRTVRDYVARTDVQKRFEEAIGAFDTNLQLCHAWMACGLPGLSNRDKERLTLSCSIHACKVSAKNLSKATQKLNELQRRIGLAEYSSVDRHYRCQTAVPDITDCCIGKGFISLAARIGVTHYVKMWIDGLPRDTEGLPYENHDDHSLCLLFLEAFLCPDPTAMIENIRLILDEGGVTHNFNTNLNLLEMREGRKPQTLEFELVTAFVTQCDARIGGEQAAVTEWNRWAPALRLLFDRGARIERKLVDAVCSEWLAMHPECDYELVFSTLEKLRLGEEDAAFECFREAFGNEVVPSYFEYDTDASEE